MQEFYVYGGIRKRYAVKYAHNGGLVFLKPLKALGFAEAQAVQLKLAGAEKNQDDYLAQIIHVS